jgi:hypothetical protein
VLRTTLQHRDLVDLFLFQNALRADAGQRLHTKLEQAGATRADARALVERLRRHADFHVRSVERILDEQIDADMAANLRYAGGGRMMVDEVIRLLTRLVGTPTEE